MRLPAVLLSLSLFATSALAAVPEAVQQQITANLKKVNSAIAVRTISESPIDGLYEVEFETGEQIFTNREGSHFVLGKLFELQGDRFVNLTEQRKQGYRAEALKALNSDDMVIFAPEGEVKATVYAFTDVDCGYCRKLHREMADYNKLGIEVRYLAFPRAGIGSQTYREMVSVWCADDRAAAMTASKTGGKVESKSCDNPVADQYELGQRFGVTGTPALVFENGELMPGYLPAAQLAAMIDDQQ